MLECWGAGSPERQSVGVPEWRSAGEAGNRRTEVAEIRPSVIEELPTHEDGQCVACNIDPACRVNLV